MHTHSPTFSLCLLILSSVHSVSDLISHSVTLSLYVSLQLMDSVMSESYIIYCIVHHVTHSIFCCTMFLSFDGSEQYFLLSDIIFTDSVLQVTFKMQYIALYYVLSFQSNLQYYSNLLCFH